jgi:two-component sensor histidine kinase
MLRPARQVLLGKPLAIFVPTKGRSAFRQELLKVLQLGARRDWELTMQPRRGEPFPALITVATAPPASSGEPSLLRWLIRDITEHKRLEAERERVRMAEIVVTEVHHRLKNHLAIIAGLLQMQVQDEPEDSPAVDTLRKAIARIMSVATVHEQLYASGIDKVDVLELTRGVASSLCQALGANAFEVWVHGDNASYPPGAAVSIALTVSELLTNAVKHGERDASGKRKADLTVSHRDETLRLTLWNSGNPVPADFVADGKPSMGLQLVRDIVRQYHGTFSMGPRDDGTYCEITFPDSRLR